MLKRFFPVWAPALALTFAVAFLPACQKETLETVTNDLTSVSVGAQDRGPGATTLAEHRRHRRDSLGSHPHDSLHLCDTTRGPRRPHHLDSLFGPHGPHGPHGDTLNNGGCRVRPIAIAVTDLPKAAQDWLTANAAGLEVATVAKVTRRDCTIEYVVRFKNRRSVTFDANGNKK